MPAVRCPSCDRRLQLPEEVVGHEARCPLCATVFLAEPEGGIPQAVAEPVRAPDPSRPWRPPGEPERLPPPRNPEHLPGSFPRGDRSDDLDRDRLAVTGTWLFGLSIAALSWDLTCGCGGVALALESVFPQDDLAIVALLAAHFAHLVALVVLLFAGQAMRNARNPLLCRIGVWVSIGELFFFAARLAMLFYSTRGRSEMGPGLLLVNLAIPLMLFVVGTIAANVLSRPGVRKILARSHLRRPGDD